MVCRRRERGRLCWPEFVSVRGVHLAIQGLYLKDKFAMYSFKQIKGKNCLSLCMRAVGAASTINWYRKVIIKSNGDFFILNTEGS